MIGSILLFELSALFQLWKLIWHPWRSGVCQASGDFCNAKKHLLADMQFQTTGSTIGVRAKYELSTDSSFPIKLCIVSQESNFFSLNDLPCLL
jgi:hypothetical protein